MTSPTGGGSEHVFRVCKECNIALTLENFNKVIIKGVERLRTKCKSCMSARQKRWYEANKELTKARTRQWSLNNADKVKESKRNYRLNNAEVLKLKERERHLLRNFNISSAQYEEMLLAQNGVCKACGNPETQIIKGSVANLAVDHDHSCCSERGKSCGKCIRGLLCSRCNMLLGGAEDSVKLLNNLINYLEGGK